MQVCLVWFALEAYQKVQGQGACQALERSGTEPSPRIGWLLMRHPHGRASKNCDLLYFVAGRLIPKSASRERPFMG